MPRLNIRRNTKLSSETDRIKKLRQKYLSPEELKNLLTAASTSIRDYAILLTAYTHALRISEVGMLEMENFKEAENRIYVKRLKEGYNNWYVMSDEVRKAIRRWVVLRGKEPGPLFLSRMHKSTKAGIGKRQLDTLFKLYAIKGGLPENHHNFHTLRHTCAVDLVNKGVPMKNIQDWLGHTNIQSTLVYAEVSDSAREKTAEIFYGGKQGAEKEKGIQVNWKGNKVKKTKEIKNLEKVREST